jgi:hypothetical protein
MVTISFRAWAGTGVQGDPCPNGIGDCMTGLFCADHYCCNKACDRMCEACNAADIWEMPGTNGTCLPPNRPRPPKNGQSCPDPAYICSSQGASCAQFCEVDDTLCAHGYYCAQGQCKPKIGVGQPCKVESECESGSCQRVDGASDAGPGESICCDVKCDGPCRACVQKLTGNPMQGTCDNVLSKAKMGPGDRCKTDQLAPCGNDGYCDGKGACSLVDQGMVVGEPKCVDDAGPGAMCVTQACDGKGHPECLVKDCSPGMCVNGVGCVGPSDAGGDRGNSLVPDVGAGDVSMDTATFEASPMDTGSEADSATCVDAGPDGGCSCSTWQDCPAPSICRIDHTCGPGRPGARCWPTNGMLSHFEEDGSCKPGPPDDPTEIVGRCSAAPGGRSVSGWPALVGVLGVFWMQQSRRRRTSR